MSDIDGVLADVREEFHFLPDWDEYFKHLQENKPIIPMLDLLQDMFLKNNDIILNTGRPESVREETVVWLSNMFRKVPWWGPKLLMRKTGDHRPTWELKVKWCKEQMPDLIIEDEPRCVKALTNAGFIVLQVHGFRFTEEDGVPK